MNRPFLFIVVCVGLLCIVPLRAEKVQYVELKGHTGFVGDAAFSADGKRIVTNFLCGTHYDYITQLFDAETGKVLQRFADNFQGVLIWNEIFSLVKDKFFLLANDEETLYWNITTGEEIQQLKGRLPLPIHRNMIE